MCICFMYKSWVSKEFREVTVTQGQYHFPMALHCLCHCVFLRHLQVQYPVYILRSCYHTSRKSSLFAFSNTYCAVSLYLRLHAAEYPNACNSPVCLTLFLWAPLLHRKHIGATDFAIFFSTLARGHYFRWVFSYSINVPYQKTSRSRAALGESQTLGLCPTTCPSSSICIPLTVTNCWTPLGRAPARDHVAAFDRSCENHYGVTAAGRARRAYSCGDRPLHTHFRSICKPLLT